MYLHVKSKNSKRSQRGEEQEWNWYFDNESENSQKVGKLQYLTLVSLKK